ncbi:hypothetical protein [Streptomyces sp. ODS28]|uniref:Rv1733c family protein n=1 Tax=Streptomyces sp. ODS28 TaxID=3136688 RepID=UPI0031E88093
MPRKVVLWRWRRNQLKRGTDRVEAWAVLVAALLLVVGGPTAGLATDRALRDGFAEQRAERQHRTAVLLRDVPERPRTREETGDGLVEAPVHWHDARGTPRTASARVEYGQRAGSRVDIWTGPDGSLAARPPGPAEAAFQSAVLGIAAGLAWCAAVVMLRSWVRTRLDRVRMRLWERDWARTGPLWSSGSSDQN